MIYHLPTCTCGCKAEDPFAVSRSDEEFERQLIDLILQSVTKIDEPLDEPGTDAFAQAEVELTTSFSSAIYDRGRSVRYYLAEAIKGIAATPSRIRDALGRMNDTMKETFSDIATEVREVLGRTINVGIGTVPTAWNMGTNGPSPVAGRGTILELDLAVTSFHDGLVNAAKYSTNQFFNTQIIPAIESQLQKLYDGSVLGEPNLQPILGVLDNRLKSVPYWNVVANAAASRAFHYGYLKAGESLRYREYEFVAVVDQRTSEICLYMNGKKFTVRDAVSLLQRSADAESPADLKQIQPWISADAARGLSDQELAAQGVMVPPLHGRCRSTIRLIG